MKHKFNLSHSLVLGSSLIVAGVTSVAAKDAFDDHQIAMYQPAPPFAAHFATSKLSADKLLAMADKLNRAPMNLAQEKLVFALTFSAANKGSAEAQFRLGNYYMDSDDNHLIIADETEAAYWLEEAIAQGHKDAKFVYDNVLAFHFDIGC